MTKSWDILTYQVKEEQDHRSKPWPGDLYFDFCVSWLVLVLAGLGCSLFLFVLVGLGLGCSWLVLVGLGWSWYLLALIVVGLGWSLSLLDFFFERLCNFFSPRGCVIFIWPKGFHEFFVFREVA